ncbi:MAG: helix-turn-helix domain-containing protein [Methylohalobius sp.]
MDLRQGGEEGLRGGKKPGRKSFLDPAQLESLKQDLTQTPRALGYQSEHWSGRLLVRHLKKRFAIVLSLRQCQRLLRRLSEGVISTSASEEKS